MSSQLMIGVKVVFNLHTLVLKFSHTILTGHVNQTKSFLGLQGLFCRPYFTETYFIGLYKIFTVYTGDFNPQTSSFYFLLLQDVNKHVILPPLKKLQGKGFNKIQTDHSVAVAQLFIQWSQIHILLRYDNFKLELPKETELVIKIKLKTILVPIKIKKFQL